MGQALTYGLISEFVGRFSRLATLDPLDHGALRCILTDAESNVMARRKDFFALHGVRLEITDDAIVALVSEALVHGTGARALRLVIDGMLRPVEHKLPEMAATGVNALIYDQDAALGISAPIEHTGKLMNPSRLLELRLHAAYQKRIAVRNKKRADQFDIFSRTPMAGSAIYTVKDALFRVLLPTTRTPIFLLRSRFYDEIQIDQENYNKQINKKRGEIFIFSSGNNCRCSPAHDFGLFGGWCRYCRPVVRVAGSETRECGGFD